MPRATAVPQSIDLSHYLGSDKAAVPIDLDWRKKYYTKVFGKRMIAFVLDYFITFSLSTVGALIIALILHIDIENRSELDLRWGLFLLQFLCFILLCALMESSRWQGTFGKYIMKIQITDKEGYSISFLRSIWRNILRIIIGYSYIFIIPLVFQIVRFRKTKKLFHDELSSTNIGVRLPQRAKG
jgi:uncharacterized RDD family membrane protein YckC